MAESPTPEPEATTSPSATKAAARRSSAERARLLAVAVLAVLATLFAVLNLGEVKVNLLFGSRRIPLILVIVACLAIGAVFGAVIGRRGGVRAGRRGRRH